MRSIIKKSYIVNKIDREIRGQNKKCWKLI